jgi:hypothetical protein
MSVQRIRTGDRRVLSVVPTGGAVRLTDHPNPTVHSGLTLWPGPARELARTLIDGGSVRVPTLEGRMLALVGSELADTSAPASGWTLYPNDKQALGDAILALLPAE